VLLLNPRRLLRAVLLTGAAVLPIVVAFDAGSVAVMEMAAKDNADEAGRAAVSSIALINGGATPAAAQTAYDAAQEVADSYGEKVDPTSFRVHSNGSVTLTVSKSTDTVLFKHLPYLKGLTSTQTTMTVDRSNW
jgi:hypothetical protein